MGLPRLVIDTYPTLPEDERHEQQFSDILTKARELGPDVVIVEVQYSETDEEWDYSGDALRIDFTTDPPGVRTITSAEWILADAEARS